MFLLWLWNTRQAGRNTACWFNNMEQYSNSVEFVQFKTNTNAQATLIKNVHERNIKVINLKLFLSFNTKNKQTLEFNHNIV